MTIRSRVIAAAVAASVAGLTFVQRQEGVVLNAYPDPAVGWRVPTICSGHTAGVKKGDRATPAQCWVMLREDAAIAAKAIDQCVHVPLTQNQVDALVSFTINVGTGAFCGSTLVRNLNKFDYQAAADQFPRWKYAGKKVLPGLVTRRAAERELFLKDST